MNSAQATYIDGLRGFAAQLVLLGHVYSMVLFPGKTTGVGDLGVIIFFILSGFLVTYTSLLKKQRGGYTFSNYFSDRFFRIFVPYIPAVFFIVLLDSYVYHFTNAKEYIEHYTVKDLFATLTMMQQHPIGLFMDKMLGASEFKLATFGSGRPLWTVASEWWLYLVFGLALFYNKKSKNFLLYFFIFLLVAIAPLFNAVAGTGQGLSLVWFLMAGLTYFYFKSGDSVGNKIAAVLKSTIKEKFLFYCLLCCLFLLMFVRFFWVSYIEPGFIFERPIFYDFNFYILLMFFLTLIFFALSGVQVKSRNKLVMFVADYSYSLYLIHYTLLFFLVSAGFTTGGKLYDFFLCYITANLVAVLFWWMFEKNHKRVQQFICKKS